MFDAFLLPCSCRNRARGKINNSISTFSVSIILLGITYEKLPAKTNL
jgi:hypothetical protein